MMSAVDGLRAYVTCQLHLIGILARPILSCGSRRSLALLLVKDQRVVSRRTGYLVVGVMDGERLAVRTDCAVCVPNFLAP